MKRSTDNPFGQHPIQITLMIIAILMSYSTNLLAGPEERTRTFCLGVKKDCGGHLQPACTSGNSCDAGFNSYSGDPFPITINCPSPISDVTVNSGCYDERPDCSDCSGPGQVPCPEESKDFCPVGCDAGLSPNPTTTLCEGSSAPGGFCSIGYPCSPGLSCDLSSSQCVAKAQAGESCANPFIPCDDGLQCTLALECANQPARLGETCDVGAPCSEGLFCQPGIPQRCQEFRKPGEGCSVVNPCVEGASCEVCLLDGCNAPLQCFPNANSGVLSEKQCRTLYSPGIHQGVIELGAARTYGTGNESAAIAGESQEIGVAYGPDGRYGCYSTLCLGINLDVGLEYFITDGFYNTFDDVGGSSFINVQEAQLPKSVVNFASTQVFGREPDQIVDNGELIGATTAFSVGIGPNPVPFSAGSFNCETVLDELDLDSGSGSGDDTVYLPPPPWLEFNGYGALSFDGDNDKLAITDTVAQNALQMSNALTLEAWIRPDKAEQDLSIINKEGEYQIGLVDGELGYSIANSNPGWFWKLTGVHPAIHRWTHVALMYGSFDGVTEQRVYVNGELIHRIAASGLIGDKHPESQQFQIGGRERYSQTFSGMIDEVRVWSRVLTEQELRAGLSQTPATSDSHFIAGWNFNETSGNTAFDIGLGGYDISLDNLGSESTPQRIAENRTQEGVGLYFDGVDDHIAIIAEDALTGLEMNNTLTLEAWVYPTGEGSGPHGGTIINKEGEYYLGRSTDGHVIYALANTTPGWVTVTSTASIPENRWSHIALTYNSLSNQVIIYLNGQSVFVRSAEGAIGDFHPEEQQLRIGGRQNDDVRDGNQRFHGAIDEVRIWNRALSSTEINQQYNEVLSPTAAGLVGYWRFNEAGMALALDETSAYRNGQLGSGRNWQTPRRINASALLGYSSNLVNLCMVKGDSDLDGICDAEDNCPLIENADQTDTDNNGKGDACEVIIPDTDNDGVENDEDQCPNTPTGETVNAQGCSNSQLNDDSSSGGGSTNIIMLLLLSTLLLIRKKNRPIQ